jgi:hypothetical protein
MFPPERNISKSDVFIICFVWHNYVRNEQELISDRLSKLLKLNWVVYKNLVRTAQGTLRLFYIKTNQFVLYWERIPGFEIHT